MSSVQGFQAPPVDLNTGSSSRCKYFIEHIKAVHALTEHRVVVVTKHI